MGFITICRDLRDYLKSSCQSCLNDPKKLIQIFVLFVCSIAVVLQVSKCLSKLINPPVISHTFFEKNNSLYYPAITLCRDPPFKIHVMKKYGLGPFPSLTSEWKNFPFDNISLSDFWTEATFSLSDNLTPAIGFNGSVDNMRFKSTMFLMNGQCHTLIPTVAANEAGQFAGYSLSLKHTMRDISETPSRMPPGWSVHIHESKDPFTENQFYTSGRVENLYVESMEQMQVKITARDFRRTPTEAKPCVKDPLYSSIECVEKCRKRHIAKYSPCEAPWMSGLGLKECNSYGAMKHLILLYKNDDQDVNIPSCDCSAPCREVLYTTSVVRRKDIKSHGIIWSQLDIFYSTKVVANIHEKIGYDFSTFVADMGGSLGFLLGVSVLGLIAFLGELAVLITRPRKSKDITEKSKDGVMFMEDSVIKY